MGGGENLAILCAFLAKGAWNPITWETTKNWHFSFMKGLKSFVMNLKDCFCCIALQIFGRQQSLSLSWGPALLNSQGKKMMWEAAKVQTGGNYMHQAAQNRYDMSGSKTEVFLVLTPVPSIFLHCCHTVTALVSTVKFPLQRTHVKVAFYVGNDHRLCTLLRHLSSAMKVIM